MFPSNRQLSLRAHGMAAATLRRHLAGLVDCGLIIRRDSPNGKRFARKGEGGTIETAFGFDLSPLVARADEFEAWAEEVRAEERDLRLMRERVTLCRRDITKMIATGIEEGVAVAARFGSAEGSGGQGLSDWFGLHTLFRAITGRIPRAATRAELEPIAGELTLLAEEILRLLETHIKTKETSASESQTERHIQNSNPEILIDLERASEKSRVESVAPQAEPAKPPQAYPLGMVLEACPDVADYARGGGGIANWRDFLAVATVVRSMLGISPSAWAAAQSAMGDIPAAIVVAAILQKGTAVTSAGGYLRELTRKAGEGQFSLGPMLMALISARKREKKRA